MSSIDAKEKEMEKMVTFVIALSESQIGIFHRRLGWTEHNHLSKTSPVSRKPFKLLLYSFT